MMWLSGFSYRTNPVLILARSQANSHVGVRPGNAGLKGETYDDIVSKFGYST